MNKDRYVISTGNLSEGFYLYGPFDSSDEADRFASMMKFSDSWHMHDLLDPEVEGFKR